MKKHKKFLLGVAIIMALTMSISSCLDPSDFASEWQLPPLTGTFDFTDVTAAVLLLTNVSRTINVLQVEITQPDFQEDQGQDEYFTLTYIDLPRSLQKKAAWLPPSPHNYNIKVTYSISGAPGVDYPDFEVTLPVSRLIEEYFIFRRPNGEVVISQNIRDADPEDTGDPEDDPLLGEGSSPAIIPPASRAVMGTFIVVNRTQTQVIDKVTFTTPSGNRSYSMGPIQPTDRRSIALGQGEWQVVVEYNDGQPRTTRTQTGVIVPSNDPQAYREHYMYFYKSTSGGFRTIPQWDPPPTDFNPEDRYHGAEGEVRVRVLNRAIQASVVGVQATEGFGTNHRSSYIHYTNFRPEGRIGAGGISWINDSKVAAFVDDGNFIIQNGRPYTISVFIEDFGHGRRGGNLVLSFEGRNFFKGHTIDIEITDMGIKLALEDEEEDNIIDNPKPPEPDFIPVTDVRVVAVRETNADPWESFTHRGTNAQKPELRTWRAPQGEINNWFMIEIWPHNATNKTALWSAGLGFDRGFSINTNGTTNVHWTQKPDYEGYNEDHFGVLRISLQARYGDPGVFAYRPIPFVNATISVLNRDEHNLAVWIDRGVRVEGSTFVSNLQPTLVHLLFGYGYFTTNVPGIPYLDSQFSFKVIY
ncbi:MAG: hypothetical protein FWG77_11580 [Treponema sp.]|nr:hypothetical protein [Treponema sp.]